MVYPNPRLGLSFATTIERLEQLKIDGEVWELPEPARLPHGLIINFEAPDPPMINVICPLPAWTVERRLRDLGGLMRRSGVKIVGGKAAPS